MYISHELCTSAYVCYQWRWKDSWGTSSNECVYIYVWIWVYIYVCIWVMYIVREVTNVTNIVVYELCTMYVYECIYIYLDMSCSVLLCAAVSRSVLQCAAACCGVLRCAAVFYGVLRCAAVCCGVLRCAAVCCSVLRCATVCCSVLHCAAVCCSVLQCAAVCCSVLWCAVIHTWKLLPDKIECSPAPCCSVLQSVAVRCSACVAVRCSVLQCVAVCCGVLQCVAVCCSELQCMAVCSSAYNYIHTWKLFPNKTERSPAPHPENGHEYHPVYIFMNYAYKSRTMYTCHELCIWGRIQRMGINTTLVHMSHELRMSFTNYVYLSRTLYITAHPENAYGYHPVYKRHVIRVYVYKSRTMYIVREVTNVTNIVVYELGTRGEGGQAPHKTGIHIILCTNHETW